jgi:hypothetical protein
VDSTTQRRLANIDRAEREGKLAPGEARDERILVRLTAVADARRRRLNAAANSE